METSGTDSHSRGVGGDPHLHHDPTADAAAATSTGWTTFPTPVTWNEPETITPASSLDMFGEASRGQITPTQWESPVFAEQEQPPQQQQQQIPSVPAVNRTTRWRKPTTLGRSPQPTTAKRHGDTAVHRATTTVAPVATSHYSHLPESGPSARVDQAAPPTAAEETLPTILPPTGLTTPTARFLVLYSGLPLNRECVANQEMAYTILDGLGLPYDTLNGADPANRDQRNELFELSGIRGQYPQFFIVDKGTTTFFGDWETFQYANDEGNLAGLLVSYETSDAAVDTLATLLFASADEESVEVQHVERSPDVLRPAGGPPMEAPKACFLVLCSGMSLSRESVANQEMAYTILDGLGLPYDKLDGADPANKDRRNELFELSGIRGQYPQFFIVSRGKTTFFGNWETFQFANDEGSLAAALSSQDDVSFPSAPPAGRLPLVALSDKVPPAPPQLENRAETSITPKSLSSRAKMFERFNNSWSVASERKFERAPRQNSKLVVPNAFLEKANGAEPVKFDGHHSTSSLSIPEVFSKEEDLAFGPPGDSKATPWRKSDHKSHDSVSSLSVPEVFSKQSGSIENDRSRERKSSSKLMIPPSFNKSSQVPANSRGNKFKTGLPDSPASWQAKRPSISNSPNAGKWKAHQSAPSLSVSEVFPPFDVASEEKERERPRRNPSKLTIPPMFSTSTQSSNELNNSSHPQATTEISVNSKVGQPMELITKIQPSPGSATFAAEPKMSARDNQLGRAAGEQLRPRRLSNKLVIPDSFASSGSHNASFSSFKTKRSPQVSPHCSPNVFQMTMNDGTDKRMPPNPINLGPGDGKNLRMRSSPTNADGKQDFLSVNGDVRKSSVPVNYGEAPTPEVQLRPENMSKNSNDSTMFSSAKERALEARRFPRFDTVHKSVELMAPSHRRALSATDAMLGAVDNTKTTIDHAQKANVASSPRRETGRLVIPRTFSSQGLSTYVDNRTRLGEPQNPVIASSPQRDTRKLVIPRRFSGQGLVSHEDSTTTKPHESYKASVASSPRREAGKLVIPRTFSGQGLSNYDDSEKNQAPSLINVRSSSPRRETGKLTIPRSYSGQGLIRHEDRADQVEKSEKDTVTSSSPRVTGRLVIPRTFSGQSLASYDSSSKHDEPQRSIAASSPRSDARKLVIPRTYSGLRLDETVKSVTGTPLRSTKKIVIPEKFGRLEGAKPSPVGLPLPAKRVSQRRPSLNTLAIPSAFSMQSEDSQSVSSIHHETIAAEPHSSVSGELAAAMPEIDVITREPEMLASGPQDTKVLPVRPSKIKIPGAFAAAKPAKGNAISRSATAPMKPPLKQRPSTPVACSGANLDDDTQPEPPPLPPVATVSAVASPINDEVAQTSFVDADMIEPPSPEPARLVAAHSPAPRRKLVIPGAFAKSSEPPKKSGGSGVGW